MIAYRMHIQAQSYARCKYLGELFCLISDAHIRHPRWNQPLTIYFNGEWSDMHSDIRILSLYLKSNERIIFRTGSNDIRTVQELWVTYDHKHYQYALPY